MKGNWCENRLSFLAARALVGCAVLGFFVAATGMIFAQHLPPRGQADAKKVQEPDEPKDRGNSSGLAPLKALEQRVQAAAKKVLPAVVAIETPRPPGASTAKHFELFGSGVIITADGLIL